MLFGSATLSEGRATSLSFPSKKNRSATEPQNSAITKSSDDWVG